MLETIRAVVKEIIGLKGQQVANFLLAALVALVGVGGWWAFDVAIPRHIALIQGGYDRIEAKHTEQVTALAKTFQEHSRSDRELFERLVSQQAVREPSLTEWLERLRADASSEGTD